jgi:serine/threonine protein kinase
MTSPLDSFIGHTIGGRFAITAVLGEGAMGAVFRGVEQGGTTGVAIKILHPDVSDDPVALARFQREVAMAAQIDHPNAVRVLDHGFDDGVPYLVMELVEGRELFDVLAEAGRLPAARAASIALQICDAVATAHDHGIVHRDLKPENVMLVGDPSSAGGERVKLLDFGIAKQIGSARGEGEGQITVAGAIIGTPAYMSPEQCEGRVVDARSDVYACGAVLYHLVTGRSPFQDESAIRTLFRHVMEAPLPPRALVPDLDPGLEAIILKALAKSPESRQQGAHVLWEELLAALPRLAHPAVPRMPVSRRLSAAALLAAGPPAPTLVMTPPSHDDGVTVINRPAWAVTPRSPARAVRSRRPARVLVPLFMCMAAAAAIAVGVVGAMGTTAQPRPANLQAIAVGR